MDFSAFTEKELRALTAATHGHDEFEEIDRLPTFPDAGDDAPARIVTFSPLLTTQMLTPVDPMSPDSDPFDLPSPRLPGQGHGAHAHCSRGQKVSPRRLFDIH